jgi:hypothetical protein
MFKRFLAWFTKPCEYQPSPQALLYIELTERVG